MSELVIPGTLGIVTDVAGLLVIMLTTIPQMYNLGLFGAVWVSSIIVTVEILHPILICYMPAPTEHEHFLPGFMVRFTRGVGWATTDPFWKYVIGGVTVILLVGSTYITLFHSKIGEATPGTPLLWPNHEFNVATDQIATRFGGVDSLVVYSDGDRPNASADAAPIKAMERFERYLKVNTNLGASVSLVPFLRNFWQINHYGDPKWYFVPVAPGHRARRDLPAAAERPAGRHAPLPDRRRARGEHLVLLPGPQGRDDRPHHALRGGVHRAESARRGVDPARRGQGRSRTRASSTRRACSTSGTTCSGRCCPRGEPHAERARSGRTTARTSRRAVEERLDATALPEWIEEFRNAAQADYVTERDSVEEGDVFTWPKNARGLGRRATSTSGGRTRSSASAPSRSNTQRADRGGPEGRRSEPKYQPTNSWTRGVQFVMAGGSMGILAAINDEVERSHVANITLILFVIFVLHSLTYQSMASGGIILLQITTATTLSLAYMALMNIGLNINTLPVQSVGVGIGVDYAIYIVDRIRQECADTADIDEAVRRAVRTTGMAVSFTATTIVGGIVLWSFSNLRFQAEMAQLLSILMVINMLGAITVVPAFYSILRPKVATALLTDEQRETIRIQKEREVALGLRDKDQL